MSKNVSVYSILRTPCLRNCILRTAVFMLLPFFFANAQFIQAGLGGLHITAITAEQGDPGEMWFPATANLIFAATKTDGIYQGLTWDNGKSWKAIGPDSSPPADIVTIAVQHWGAGPRDGIHLMASVRNPRSTPGFAAVIRREVSILDPDAGEWVRADSGITQADTSTIVYAMAPFYYTGHTPPQPIPAWTGTRPLRGSPAGVFWEEGGETGWFATSMDVTPKWFGSHVWAAGSLRQGVGDAALFRSTDQGTTWKARALGLPIPGVCSAVAVCPGHPDTVAFAIGVKVMLSFDAGENFHEVFTSTAGRPVSVLFDPLYPMHLYVATDGEFAVYQSRDFGQNWAKLPVAPRPDRASITCMTIALLDTVPMGRPPRRGIFVGTSGSGVWLYDIDMSVQAIGIPPKPHGMEMNLFPNPARDRTSLSIAGSNSSELTIEIRDILGRSVLRRLASMYGSSPHTLSIDTQALPAGSYLVSLLDQSVLSARLLHIVR